MENKNYAYVINTGIITAIGNNTGENLEALLQGRSGISLPEYLQTTHRLPVGEIKISNEGLAMQCKVTKPLPRTALLSIKAVSEVIAPIQHCFSSFRIAFLSGNTVGGMDLTEDFYKDFKEDRHSGDLRQVKYHECGAITDVVAEHLHLNSWNSTISTACSSSANTIMMAARLIESDRYDMVIAGGTDGLSRFTLNGFNSLMILDKEPCRPFDENRQGLNLGEGAAYLLLAGEKVMKKLNAVPLAAVSGYANANDAHHQTASSPEGLGNQLAMCRAIKQANILPRDVSYINLHGTGTGNNDSSEGIAVSRLFEGRVPPASSTKAFTGHTLGAAGAVEAVYSVLAIQQQKIWPHLRWQTQMKEFDWKPVSGLRDAVVQHVLSNSFGFGGNCSALVFSKI